MKRDARRKDSGGFWDRPQMMHLMADMLMFAATAALAYAAVLALVRLPLFPLREVVVTSPVQRVTASQLAKAARTAVVGNFFTVDLEQVRRGFETLPWIRSVQVRRRWPSGIELSIEEQQAAAVWNAGGTQSRLVNKTGEVFAASGSEGLPHLAGPEGTAPDVLQRYREFAAVVAPVGRKPDSVALSSRLAWQVRLDDGLVIELGRDRQKSQAGDRLRRFVSVYRETLARLPLPAATVDLRYPNGFTVRPAAGRTPTQSKP
jgi:cell division protein FtsQ